ncbi:hypothetical protein BKA63DRAFT_538457 [Paraphoma chrysanthemicola]|nr:hypothetical protein BKA63DRAFT_538457 [Paraphoma chrysanthemicola]
MQYFTTQLNNHQQTTHSLRASQYRKRKISRDDEDEDEEEDERSSPEPARKPTSTRGQSRASYASPDIAQLRVAGLLPIEDLEIPPPPFPHAPPQINKEHYGPSKVYEEVVKPPARLYAVDAPLKVESIAKQSETASLRKRHLNVLSTLMHRCLLEQDYERAGRAWGMLLRTQVAGGHPVDPRNHGRWGIGAEVLLRRRPGSVTANDHVAAGDGHDSPPDMFSEEGFELAREYYERLIIQFPNRKTAPNAVDERTFYPAMFSLWIFEVSEKSNMARLETIQVEELARATEIAERLDQLVASPPFDKQASLLQLRGNVGLWVSDLLSSRLADDEDLTSDVTLRNSEDVAMSNAEHLARLNNCRRELEQAQQFFRRAETNGKPLVYALLLMIKSTINPPH